MKIQIKFISVEFACRHIIRNFGISQFNGGQGIRKGLLFTTIDHKHLQLLTTIEWFGATKDATKASHQIIQFINECLRPIVIYSCHTAK